MVGLYSVGLGFMRVVRAIVKSRYSEGLDKGRVLGNIEAATSIELYERWVENRTRILNPSHSEGVSNKLNLEVGLRGY